MSERSRPLLPGRPGGGAGVVVHISLKRSSCFSSARSSRLCGQLRRSVEPAQKDSVHLRWCHRRAKCLWRGIMCSFAVLLRSRLFPRPTVCFALLQGPLLAESNAQIYLLRVLSNFLLLVAMDGRRNTTHFAGLGRQRSEIRHHRGLCGHMPRVLRLRTFRAFRLTASSQHRVLHARTQRGWTLRASMGLASSTPSRSTLPGRLSCALRREARDPRLERLSAIARQRRVAKQPNQQRRRPDPDASRATWRA